MKKFYEQDIKDIILEKKHIFLRKGDTSTVLFEKAICISSTIADCLIFSREKGIIGVEIKTEHDTTRRLNKQLKNYSLVCDYVYVLCHDNHVWKVEDILNKNKYHHVGILAYTEFRDDVILGVYKQPEQSPTKDVHVAYQMLWKEEISKILGSFKRQMRTLREFDIKINDIASRGSGIEGLYVKSNASNKHLRKGDMIKAIVNRIGPKAANNLLCDIFINRKMSPDKLLKYHYFKVKDE